MPWEKAGGGYMRYEAPEPTRVDHQQLALAKVQTRLAWVSLLVSAASLVVALVALVIAFRA